MSSDEKKTECVKVHMTARLLTALSVLANDDDRALSEYINRVLSLHAFGHCARGGEKSEGPDRA